MLSRGTPAGIGGPASGWLGSRLGLGREAVHGLDAYRFTAALKLSGIYKSLALTLAVVEAERDALAAHDLSRIDEKFQTERWGEDAEAARRVAHEREELVSVASFLAALD